MLCVPYVFNSTVREMDHGNWSSIQKNMWPGSARARAPFDAMFWVGLGARARGPLTRNGSPQLGSLPEVL